MVPVIPAPYAAALRDAHGLQGNKPQPLHPIVYNPPPRPPSKATNDMVDYPTGRAQIIQRMPLLMRQKYLNQHGYQVTVDGKHGPQTATAVKAFVKGIPGAYWTKIWNANHPQPVPGTGTDVAPNAHPALPYTPPTPAPAAGHAPPPPAPDPRINVPGVGNVNMINPTAYANSAMETKYGPAAAELVRQMAQAKADQGSHQTDIKNWFAQILGDQKTGAASNVAALGGILSGADKANVGLVNALGGSANAASSNVASLGTIGRNALEQLAAHQANFDDTQHTAIGQQGVEAANNEYAKGQKVRDDLASQMLNLNNQRGSDYTTTLQGAQQDRFKQQLAIHDAKVANAMLPGQLRSQTDAHIAAQNANSTAEVNTKYLQAKIKAMGTSTATDWSKATTRNDWHDAVTQSVSDRNGALVTDPATAWTQIQHLMGRNGLDGNGTAMADAKQALQDALSRSHARGLYKNWVWGPKGLVQLAPKPKKKK